jgi:hypothetical protein
MISEFKAEAIKLGYTVFYDRSLVAWTIIKEGYDTEYLPSYILKNTPVEKLIKVYLK